jgi:hypothetical protein
MPNRSYQKGYRFERKVQAWLAHLGECTRSMMSRGADLTLTFSLRKWSVSCKCRANAFKFVYDELSKEYEDGTTPDILALGADRQLPVICMLAPKFLELMGKAEALDLAELNKSEAA